MSRVLLLNPPGRKNYIRDYFCSKVSKAAYQSAPATLLALSGTIGAKHEVAVQDAIVEGLSAAESLRRVQALRPEVVVSLVGSVCWDEDREFLAQVKAATGAYLIGIGDVLLADTQARLAEAPGLDAALLSFATADVLALIPKPDGPPVANVVYRWLGGFVDGGRVRLQGNFRWPRPRHELFPLRSYRSPFAIASPSAVVLTDYGCPYTCGFCVIPTLGFGARPLADVLEELSHLHTLGIKEIFFIDQTFGVAPERTLALCEVLRELRFHWSCFSRVDVTTPDLLAAMAQAGCHTIIYGVESGSQAVLTRYQKKLELQEIEPALRACRRAGIRTAATFLLGLPGETAAQVQATVDLALRLPLDFAAFNVAVPRAGTALRTEAVAAGWIPATGQGPDQSGTSGALGTAERSAAQILAGSNRALRRFYLRPGYWLHRLLTLRSWWDFKTQARDGWGVLREAVFRGRI